jgi:3-dehydroquinate synthase
MVDAALGGKNGVDLNSLKNQIGVIRLPDIILIDTQYLKFLPEIQLLSGFAEMIKHGLIGNANKSYFYNCMQVENFTVSQVESLINESVQIKSKIVEEDINETGLRKALNYGHTLGHALESYRMSLQPDYHLFHGEAIAIGLILETYISHKLFGFPKEDLEQLKSFVHRHYQKQHFEINAQDKIIELMKFDKKNVKDKVNFVLLKTIGVPRFDCLVDNVLIYEAFEYYQN